MKTRRLSKDWLMKYVQWLEMEERSSATIEKYRRDLLRFQEFVGEKEVNKTSVLEYKQWLIECQYASSSVNSMLASVNGLLAFLGWEECRVKNMRIQQPVYCPESKELTKEEYVKLILEARRQHNPRMELLIQTVCCTGIRISELRYITVEAVRKGETMVSCKGKTRKIFLVETLRKQLMKFIYDNKIESGPIFVTNRGNPMDRSNIWREMKQLCEDSDVAKEKVTPHNLRHLFARTFYEKDKDIAKLADILGHSSINTTRIYIITTESEHRKCMENLQLTV